MVMCKRSGAKFGLAVHVQLSHCMSLLIRQGHRRRGLRPIHLLDLRRVGDVDVVCQLMSTVNSHDVGALEAWGLCLDVFAVLVLFRKEIHSIVFFCRL